MVAMKDTHVPSAAYDGIISSGDVTRALIAARAGARVFHIRPERDLPLFDGLAALEIVRTMSPDVLLLDWQLPVLSGSQIMRIVRSPDVFSKPNLPINMLASQASHAQVCEAMLLGVLTALAVLGGIALVVALFMQRGRDGIDLSLGGLTRVYLYLASLAGVIVFTIGLAGVLTLPAAVEVAVIEGALPRHAEHMQLAKRRNVVEARIGSRVGDHHQTVAHQNAATIGHFSSVPAPRGDL